MENQQEINFKDLKDLGFKQIYLKDDVHKIQHGYDDFCLFYQLNKRFRLEWDHNDRYAHLYRFEKMKKGVQYSENVEAKIDILNLDEILKYLYMFGHLTKEEYNKKVNNKFIPNVHI